MLHVIYVFMCAECMYEREREEKEREEEERRERGRVRGRERPFFNYFSYSLYYITTRIKL